MAVRMVTEQVEDMAVKLKDLSHVVYHATDQLKSQANRGFWTGASAEDFTQQINATCSRLHGLAEEAIKLVMDIIREEEEWVNVDQQGVYRLKKICVAPQIPEIKTTIGMDMGARFDEIENNIYNRRYKNFVNWWKTQSVDERKQYLQGLQNRLADRYGMPGVLVVIDDLQDPENRDMRGVNIGGVLVLDVDNLNTDDPWRLLETTFHETRHEYQREVAANYQNSGQIPEGMTQQQVEKWVYEYDNYIKGEDNFVDYYYQAIETDARKYGDILMKDALNDMDQGGSSGAW